MPRCYVTSASTTRPGVLTALPAAADEAAGAGAGGLAALEDRGAGDEGRLVAFGTLHEALAPGGQVVDDLGCVQA